MYDDAGVPKNNGVVVDRGSYPIGEHPQPQFVFGCLSCGIQEFVFFLLEGRKLDFAPKRTGTTLAFDNNAIFRQTRRTHRHKLCTITCRALLYNIVLTTSTLVPGH